MATTERERRLYKVLQNHVIPTEGEGGTAYKSYCVCSCGERNEINGGLRSDALAKARLHVVREILKEIARIDKPKIKR